MQLQYHVTKILNRLKLHFSSNRMLLLATVISLFLHTLILTTFSISLPELDDNQQMLEMRLVKLQSSQNTPAIPKQEKTTIPADIPPTAPEETEAPQPEVTPVAEQNNIEPVTENHTNQEQVPTNEQATAETPHPELVDPALSTEQTDSKEVGNTAIKPASQVYKYVETEFEVRRGTDSSAAGVARIVLNIKEDSTYRLTSLTEAKGLAALIFDKLQQVSEGKVTENGLIPYYYLYQYGSSEKRTQHADFLWSDGTLEMFSAKGRRTEKLSSGIQDFLSFMYQFMFIPPLESNIIMMTNGKSLRTYTYSFQGEELIQTKFETLNTIHLLKQGDEEEKTELWLAVDYQNLPVKIRKTEKDGSVIEQTATKISTISP